MSVLNPYKIITVKCRACSLDFISTEDHVRSVHGWVGMKQVFYNCPKCDHCSHTEKYITIKEWVF